MWAITPTYAVIYGLLSWVLLCWERIWLGAEPRKPANPVLALLFATIRRVFLLAYAFFGMYLLDIAARICFSGLIGYGRVGYIAAPVALSVSLGVLYIVRCAGIAPAWMDLAAFGGMAGVYLFMTVHGSGDGLRSALYVGVGIAMVSSVVDALFRNGKTLMPNSGAVPRQWSPAMSGPLWDWSPTYKRMMDTKVYIGILVLLSVELVLLMEGGSLLYWL